MKSTVAFHVRTMVSMMATWFGTYGDDWKSFNSLNYSHDSGFGFGGDDVLLGGGGNDLLDGGTGDDYVSGDYGDDIVYGNEGNDNIFGGSNYDTIYGGTGVDRLTGGSTSTPDGYGDKFYFDVNDTGDLDYSQADTIWDFEIADQIYLKGSYTYAGATSTPGNGQYGIWQDGTDWVVTYNSSSTSGYHDIIVKGENPLNDISFF